MGRSFLKGVELFGHVHSHEQIERLRAHSIM
jgi:hypothetical protein